MYVSAFNVAMLFAAGAVGGRERKKEYKKNEKEKPFLQPRNRKKASLRCSFYIKALYR
jgi:hypothetical protein